jgi:NAD(P)H dehydrogenase (quinone)
MTTAPSRILVLYDSHTGNVAKMAALVAEGAEAVPWTEVRLRSVDEATAEDVLWCEGIAVGSPTNMGILSWKTKRFWDETMRPHWMQIDGRIGCAFSSAGGWGGGYRGYSGGYSGGYRGGWGGGWGRGWRRHG